MKDFKDVLSSDPDIKHKLQELKNDVHNFALKFPMPGFDDH
jgi:glycine hydroxymethyltransferase